MQRSHENVVKRGRMIEVRYTKRISREATLQRVMLAFEYVHVRVRLNHNLQLTHTGGVKGVERGVFRRLSVLLCTRGYLTSLLRGRRVALVEGGVL